MKAVSLKILYDNGVERKYIANAKEGVTDKELYEAVEELENLFSESFKDNKHGSFSLATQFGINIMANLSKITSVEIEIIEI